MVEERLEEKLLSVGMELIAKGLVEGTGGNISVRPPRERWFLITPSGIPYSEIEATDLVKMDLEGEIIEGQRKPSIEKELHLQIYRQRADVNAVVHTHSVFASAVAAARRGIPPILDSIVATIGGEIKVAPYARPGSRELALYAAEILKESNGVLLANHGAVGIGEDLDQALERCLLIERAAKVLIFSSLLGDPVSLSQRAIEEELEFFRYHYGQ